MLLCDSRYFYDIVWLLTRPIEPLVIYMLTAFDGDILQRRRNFLCEKNDRRYIYFDHRECHCSSMKIFDCNTHK